MVSVVFGGSCRFASLFVIAECFFQMPNYLGGLLEHSLELRLIYLDYILSQTILYFPQSLLHFSDIVARITFRCTNHFKAPDLPVRPREYQPLLTGDRSRIATRNGRSDAADYGKEFQAWYALLGDGL